MSFQVTETAVAPVERTERIQIVDILRGFALFGILAVNMRIFSHPIQAAIFPVDPATLWYDRAALWLIHMFGEGKFYALFSMLFGLGLNLMMERVERRGGQFVPLYIRRLLILLGIGVLHAILVWMGDILIMYALLGFLLVLFRKAKPRTLLIWVIAFILLPFLFNIYATRLVSLGRSYPGGAAQIDASFARVEAGYRAEMERAYQVYAHGNYLEITVQRFHDYTFLGPISYSVMASNVMAMFLLGLFFGKRMFFRDLEDNREFFRQVAIWGLPIGLAGNIIYASLILTLSRVQQSWTLFLATAAQELTAPLLMLGYVSIICLLALKPGWNERLNFFAPVGQMALTNYLAQSIVCTLIFYNYGLGLFGKVGPAVGIGLTLGIYLLQIPISHWWMNRFRYGPAEWLWRSLTYMKVQPMRR